MILKPDALFSLSKNKKWVKPRLILRLSYNKKLYRLFLWFWFTCLQAAESLRGNG